MVSILSSIHRPVVRLCESRSALSLAQPTKPTAVTAANENRINLRFMPHSERALCQQTRNVNSCGKCGSKCNLVAENRAKPQTRRDELHEPLAVQRWSSTFRFALESKL